MPKDLHDADRHEVRSAAATYAFDALWGDASPPTEQPAESTPPPLSRQDELSKALMKLSGEMAGLRGKSLEGCAKTMGDLLRVERELYPMSVEALAQMAVQNGIGPAEFMDYLKQQWEAAAVQDA